ncbi:MAG: methyltransferase [Myxococcota bacterium]|nr:methyltransferase [Myxococcota bacterium]
MSEKNLRLSFEGAFARLTLERRPRRKKEERRAWDAADQLLLQEVHLRANESSTLLRTPLIIGDHFGALTLSLLSSADCEAITLISDSAVSWRAIEENAKRNGLASALQARVTRLGSRLSWPEAPSIILVRAPKSQGQLRFLLSVISTIITAQHPKPLPPILLGAMRSRLSPSLIQDCRRLLGEPVPTPTVKRARVLAIDASGEAKSEVQRKPPRRFTYTLGEAAPLLSRGLILSAGPAVFSPTRLDLGARFLLDHLPEIISPLEAASTPRVLDLGCGGGVLGLSVAKALPRAHVSFIDENAQAIESVHESWAKNMLGVERRYRALWCDGIPPEEHDVYDLILLNPPFHQGRAVDESLPLQLFKESARALKPSGVLWVVYNRHLPHQRALTRLFQIVERRYSGPKFLLVSAAHSRE